MHGLTKRFALQPDAALPCDACRSPLLLPCQLPWWHVHSLQSLCAISNSWSCSLPDAAALCLYGIRAVLCRAVLWPQAAAMRPTARYLQQHRFVVNQRPSNATCLSKLLEQVRPNDPVTYSTWQAVTLQHRWMACFETRLPGSSHSVG